MVTHQDFVEYDDRQLLRRLLLATAEALSQRRPKKPKAREQPGGRWGPGR